MRIRSRLTAYAMAFTLAAVPVRLAAAQEASAPADEADQCIRRGLEQISRDDASHIISFAAMLLAMETMCPRPMNRLGERVYRLAWDAARLCANRYAEWNCAPRMVEAQFHSTYRTMEKELSSAASRSQLCTDSGLSELAARLEAGVGLFASMLHSIEQDSASLKQRCEGSWLDGQTPDRK